MKTQTIRKDAQKKLEALFSAATKITVDTEYRDAYTDCFETVSRTSNIGDVRQFMSDNYFDLRITLEIDDQGNNNSMTIRTRGWSKHEFTVSFLPQPPAKIETVSAQDAPIKPRMTWEAVQAYLKHGFISPLNHGAQREEEVSDPDKEIVVIKVISSESSVFNKEMQASSGHINKFATLEQYNRLTWLTLAKQRRWTLENGESYGGYDKTYLEITTAAGKTMAFRHDISIKEPLLTQIWSQWVDYCRKPEPAQIH